MKIIIDIRKIRVRGSERILLDVTDPVTMRTVSLQPIPVDSAFDNLQFVILDMLEQSRDSGAHQAMRFDDGETPTALIKKPRKTDGEETVQMTDR